MISSVSISSSHYLLHDSYSESPDEDDRSTILSNGRTSLYSTPPILDSFLSEEVNKLFGDSPLIPEASQTFFHLCDDRVWKEGLRGSYHGELDYKLRRNGYGLMQYHNGDAYLGHWNKDEPQGNGILFDSRTGIVSIGYWESVSKLRKWLSVPNEVTHKSTKRMKSNLNKAIKTFKIIHNFR
nr:uncharacterized protein LOC121115060 [Lepeophtheirus salmonis]